MSPEEFLRVVLKPRAELWADPRFQALLKETSGDVDELKKMALTVTKASVQRNNHQAQILEKLGLEPPESAEDTLRLHLALRSVVNFWEGKLAYWKGQSQKAEEVEKQLARQANSALGR